MINFFAFLLTFLFFPLSNQIPYFFYLVFIFLIFLKKYRNFFFFFLVGIICKSLTISHIPLKEIENFKGKVLSFPYEGEYGISLIVKWENWGVAPIYVNEFSDKYPLPGSLIKVKAERLIQEASPKPFSKNYKFYLKIKSINQIEVIKKPSIFYFPAKINYFFYEKFKKRFEKYKSLKTLSNSLIFSRFSQEDENFFKTFQMAGIIHILCISGLHIGIISFYFLIFLRILKLKPKLIYIFLIFFLLFYSSFCGFKPAVLRASIMVSLYFFSILIHKPLKSIECLYLSAPLNGLIMPSNILTAGFFLSYLSTYILLKSAEIFKSKIKSYFFSSFHVQIFIQPFLIYSYGIFNWQAIILNPLIFPLASFFIFTFPISFIFPKFFNLFSTFLFEIVQGTQKNLWWGSFIPYLKIKYLIFYYAISIFLIEFLKNKKDLGKILTILFLFILTIHSIDFQKPDKKIIFFDVGHGSSILIKDEFSNILIDTGKRSYYGWLLPGLLKENVCYLNFMILTHPDVDHDRWAEEIIETIPLGGLGIPEIFKKEYENLIEKAKNKKIKVYFLKRNNFFKSENLNFKILNPELKFYKNKNDGSIVLEIFSKKNSFLLMADVTEKVEMEILNYITEKPKVLNVAHHGSKSSTSAKFLNCLKPKISLISTGKKNVYGHPSQEVLKNLKENKILILRTDERGKITFNF